MQRVINLVAVVSFVLSSTATAAIFMMFYRVQALKQLAISRIELEVQKSLTEALPGETDRMMNMLPKNTGPAIPSVGK